jgi:hypothetical protein
LVSLKNNQILEEDLCKGKKKMTVPDPFTTNQGDENRSRKGTKKINS